MTINDYICFFGFGFGFVMFFFFTAIDIQQIAIAIGIVRGGKKDIIQQS